MHALSHGQPKTECLLVATSRQRHNNWCLIVCACDGSDHFVSV